MLLAMHLASSFTQAGGTGDKLCLIALMLLITFLDLGVEPLEDGLGITHEDEVVVARLDLQVSLPRADRRFAREPVLFVFASVGDVNVAHSALFPLGLFFTPDRGSPVEEPHGVPMRGAVPVMVALWRFGEKSELASSALFS